MDFVVRHVNLNASFTSASISGKQTDFSGVVVATIECLINLKTLVWDAVPTQVKISEVQVQQGKFKVD
jgi:hypothetical protein